MTDLIKCPECGEYFNPAYLDQVAKHMHDGVEIDETFKGEKSKMDIVQYNFFEPMAGYIRSINSENYFEFELPPELIVDKEQVFKYFDKDVDLKINHNGGRKLCGTILDKGVAKILMHAYYTNGIKY